MINTTRRIFILVILFGLMLLTKTIGTSGEMSYPRTLAVVGFIILASFTLGELFQTLRLPKVTGYIFAGLIFGLSFFQFTNFEPLFLINKRITENLSVINNIALAVIALIAGLELKYSKLKKVIKTGLVLIILKFLFIFILITGSFYLLFPLFSQSVTQWQYLLAGGLLISIIALGTSIELTIGVSEELNIQNDLVELTLSTSILKDLLNIILLVIVIFLIKMYLLPEQKTELSNPFVILLTDFGKTIVAGGVLGALTVFYLRYINLEVTFFLICLIIFGGYAASLFHFETLLMFVIAGMITSNFAPEKEFEEAAENLSLPVFILFFTLAGATIDLSQALNFLPLAGALFLIRIVALFLSVRSAVALVDSPAEIKRFGWSGFIPIGVLMLGFAGIIASELPLISELVSGIIYSFILLNLLLGPIIYRSVLVYQKNNQLTTQQEEIKPAIRKQYAEKLTEVNEDYQVAFAEPDFFDDKLNKIFFDLYFKLIELVNGFRDSFVTKRNYETEDILKETVAIYRDKFLGIESILKSGKDPRAIKAALQSIRINQTEVLLDKLEERKKIERDFANSDTLIKKLLNDLLEITSTLDESYPLSTEIDYATYSRKPLFFKFFILKLKIKTGLKTIFTGDSTAIVKVNLKNYSRYYLNVKTTTELLETINLTGGDRLNLFRKLKAIHKNFIYYLDDLITTIGQEKSSLGFMPVFYMQYEELKAMFFNELDVYIEEQSATVMNIEKRLTYAFASPYNNLLHEIKSLIRLEKRGLEINFFKEYEESQQVKESLFDSIRYWVIYYQGIIGLLQKELYIYKFEIQLNNFLDKALLNLADEISERIRTGSSKITEQFRQMIIDVKALLPLGFDTLKAYSDHFRMSFVIPELSSLIRDLDKTTRSRKLRTFFDTVINGIKSVAKELPEEAAYLDEEELNLQKRIPVFTKLKTFEIRNQTSSFLLLKLPREIGDVNEFLVDYVDAALKEIRNLESSVNYYLDSIVKRMQEDPEDQEGVEDILNTLSSNFLDRLREIENNNDKLEQAINKQVADKTEVAVSEIKRLIRQAPQLDRVIKHEVNTIPLKVNYGLRFVKVVVKKSFHNVKTAISNTYKRLIFPLFARSYERFKIISGRLGTSYKEDLFRLDEVLNGLPFIYRRLFDGTSLESSEMFLGKEEIKQILNEAQLRFKNRLPSSVLITGAPGTGKTSCLYFIKNDLLRPGDYLEFYFLERISTVDELRKLISEAFGYNDLKSVEAIIIDLNERFRGKTVLLTNLHKTFVRSVDGFEALKTMLHIISMTSANILWIVSVQSTGWQFIKTNFKAASLFTFSISLEELNKRRVKEIILHRQKTTGFGFRFTEDDLYLLRKKMFSASKAIEDQRYLEQVYFERLTDYADGNIVAAMNYWLNSIKKIDGNTLIIQTYKEYPLIDISFLDTNLITVLHTVMLHGGLKKSQLAQSLNISESQAGEALNKLLSLNLLKIGELTKSHDYYYTNKFKFKSIQYELKNRNILP